MRYLITGGCGFLGTALISRLLKDKFCDVRIIDNLTVGTRDDLRALTSFKEVKGSEIKSSFSGVELVIADIRDCELAIKAASGCDVVIHLAANTGVGPSIECPRLDMESNVIGLFNYLEAARIQKVKKFIFASSGAPVGEVDPPIHEKVVPRPISPYGASKLAGEGYCSAYYRSYGVETVSLRFSNVYGPGSRHKNSVVARFIKNALAGDEIDIYGDGRQTRDFIFVDDLVGAIISSINEKNIGGEIFQIATGCETSVLDLAEVVKDQIFKNTGFNVQLKSSASRIGDVRRNFSDATKARDILRWSPSISLKEGISRTIEYFLGENKVDNYGK